MERLAELAAIPLREELAGWHIRICVGVPNVFSPVSKGNQKKLLVRNMYLVLQDILSITNSKPT